MGKKSTSKSPKPPKMPKEPKQPKQPKRPKADFDSDGDRAQVIEFIKEHESKLFGQNLDPSVRETTWADALKFALWYLLTFISSEANLTRSKAAER